MFESLKPKPADAILALISAFKADERTGKIDLGVGVYRDEQGHTPVFAAVKQAERILLEEQPSKSYLGIEGDPVFVDLLRPIVFGARIPQGDIVGFQTPGGSGALRLGADLIAAAKAGDASAVADAQDRWTANADDIAAFLAAANPRSWPLAEMKAMLHDHLALTTEEALARLHGDWTADVAAYDKIHVQALGMADMLSKGIIRQFPARFH